MDPPLDHLPDARVRENPRLPPERHSGPQVGRLYASEAAVLHHRRRSAPTIAIIAFGRALVSLPTGGVGSGETLTGENGTMAYLQTHFWPGGTEEQYQSMLTAVHPPGGASGGANRARCGAD